MSADVSRRRKWLFRLFKVAVVLSVLWGVKSTLQTSLADLAAHRWTLHAGWIGAAALFYLLATIPCGLFWHRLLLALGQRPRWLDSLRAFEIGQLGKYVPGKAMVVVIRAGLVGQRGVDPRIAGLGVFLETLTMMASGACFAAAILIVIFPEPWLILLAVLMLAAAGLPTWPPLFRYLVRRVPGRVAGPDADRALERVGGRSLLEGWLLMAGAWILMGLSLWAVLRALGVADPNPLVRLPIHVATMALAMVAGFLSLIPGGLGVRDMILVALLAPQFPDDQKHYAVLSAVFMRLVSLLTEIFVSAILYPLGRGAASVAPPPASDPSRDPSADPSATPGARR